MISEIIDAEMAQLPGIITLVREMLTDKYKSNLVEAFVFGSRAKARQAKPTSDLDLMIVLGESGVSPRTRRQDLVEFDHWSGPEVNAVIYTAEEFRQYPPLTWSLLRGQIQILNSQAGTDLLEGLAIHAQTIGLEWFGDNRLGYWKWRT